MRVLLLSRYGRLGASSRIRSLQYLPFLRSTGWRIDHSLLLSNQYLRLLYTGGAGRLQELLSGYGRRLVHLLSVHRYDLVWIEKEIFPFIPAIFEQWLNAANVSYAVDYDDALFHRYDRHPSAFIRAALGRKIDRVMAHSALVVAGNEYLAGRARAAGANRIELVPTVVDLNRYRPRVKRDRNPAVVGWIGTPKTSHYLKAHAPVWRQLASVYNVQFVAVGPSPMDLVGTPWIGVPWSENSEVESIQHFDIGIMPLPDSPWERGKCGYKLIQYMACGLPVVASPVGVNREIVEPGINGYLAESDDQWTKSVSLLIENSDLRLRLGKAGRRKIEKWYSLQVQAPRLAIMLAEAGRRRQKSAGAWA